VISSKPRVQAASETRTLIDIGAFSFTKHIWSWKSPCVLGITVRKQVQSGLV
jgi:hypothetical protein